MKKIISSEKGQLVAAVLMLLVIMATLVPIMVMYTVRESKWTVAQSENTTAFHVAEAGTEKAYNALTVTTSTWVDLMKGTPPQYYRGDKTFTDINGGTYAISVSSGPGSQQATIIVVARDSLKKETRAIQVVYSNSPFGQMAIISGNGAAYTGNNMEVEWGGIMSPQAISTGGRAHPQFWSATAIYSDAAQTLPLDINGATPPNCDQPNCCQWHTYNSNIPPLPTIDFNFYKSSAQLSGAGPGTCGNYYQAAANNSWKCTDTSGKPYYFESDVTLSNLFGYVWGTVIVMGNFSTGNGNLGGAAETVSLPNNAWKQYCNDWAYYTTNYDPLTIYAAFPGLNTNYTPALTKSISPIFIGLVYVNGNFTGPTGGGNIDFVDGVIYVKGTVTLNSNSHVKVYYGSNAQNGLQTTQILLSRTAWKDSTASWPGGLAW